jgi:SAM-dependent methyltransferase
MNDQTSSELNHDEVQRFAGQVFADLSSAFAGAMTLIGHRLGLYRMLAEGGPQTSMDLAQRTGTHERYVREWLHGQRAGGYVDFDPASARFALSAEQAAVLAVEASPALMTPAFDVAADIWNGAERLAESFRSGRGIGWGEHGDCLFHGTEVFFRNGYRRHLTTDWIPALDGMDERLHEGATVADVGCGHGASTIVMAEAYPASRFVGFDYHEESVRIARQRAIAANVDDRVRFEVASAADFPGEAYDLICFMDAYHDLGDPVRAAKRSVEGLADDGTLMLVEPRAASTDEDNTGPVARLYYAASTAICTPNAISQLGGVALGAQAGPERLKETLAVAGFGDVRVVTENDFNLVIQARR